MKNKKNLRRILTLAAVAAMLVTTAAASSIITTKTIEVSYMDIKLVVDGVEITPKDAKGKVVDPFISGGTTYLPVRAVGEALGKEVTWDGDTKTVYLGTVPGEEENWVKKLPAYEMYGDTYDGSDPRKFFTVAGVQHTVGYRIIHAWDSGTLNGAGIWNTNGQYKTMTFTVGHEDGTGQSDLKLEVYLDDVFLTDYDYAWSEPPKTITVPLNYSANVKLVFKSYRGCGWGIYDISFS